MFSAVGYTARSGSQYAVPSEPDAPGPEVARLGARSGSRKSGGKCAVPVKFRLPCIKLFFRFVCC